MADDEWDAEVQRRWLLLLQHYGLANITARDRPKLASRLALALIQDFVPGLKIRLRRKSGRPPNARQRHHMDTLEEIYRHATDLRRKNPRWSKLRLAAELRAVFSTQKAHPLRRKGPKTWLRMIDAALTAEFLGLLLGPRTKAHDQRSDPTAARFKVGTFFLGVPARSGRTERKLRRSPLDKN